MHEQIQRSMADARKTPEYAEEKDSEPKPTGEWTADTVRRLEFDNTDRRYDAIADAHNAALAVRQQHIDNLDAVLESAKRESAKEIAASVHYWHGTVGNWTKASSNSPLSAKYPMSFTQNSWNYASNSPPSGRT